MTFRPAPWRPRSFAPFPRMRAAVAASLLLAGLLSLGAPARAQFADPATSQGRHVGRIFWVQWGTAGDNVFGGRTVTAGFNIGTPATPANRLDITCSLSNAIAESGPSELVVYTPGSWQGDGLDELYNIGGNHPGTGSNPNDLSIGLATGTSGQVAFDFSCSATLGGQPFDLSGLVFADAEASGGVEYVAARLTSGGQIRVIDQIAQCRTALDNQHTAVTVTGAEVRFGAATPSSCENVGTPGLRAGPALVGYVDGATSAQVVARGGGKSAVAVGAVLDLEFSEAIPASYGHAVHVRNAVWSGGLAVTGADYNNPANLATIQQGVRLGATVQADSGPGPIGAADVDALPMTTGPDGGGYADVPSPDVSTGGGSYTIANVACVGPAFVAGWIDFNGNGAFDAGERSGQESCAAGSGSVSLTWSIPADAVPQATGYLRLRLSPNVEGVADPAGVVTDGEVEDYRLAITAVADLRIEKTANAGTVASGQDVTYTLAVANDGPAAADGARVTDPAVAGLDCSTATVTCGSAAGGAVCPASPTIAALQGAGLVIPTLPAGSSLEIALTCTVTATGEP